MGKAVYYTLNDDTIVELNDEQLARIDERAERGDDAYYADIPEITDDFLRNAKVMYPVVSKTKEEQAQEEVSLRLNRETLNYFRENGEAYETHISAALDEYVARQQQA